MVIADSSSDINFVTTTVRNAEGKVREAVTKEAVARKASASAAKAQVNAEAEVIRLKMKMSRLSEEAKTTLRCSRAEATHDNSYSLIEELKAERDALRKLNADARAQVDELDAVLRARTRDVTQLGQVIISVFKGETLAKDLGIMAASIANIIGSKVTTVESLRSLGDQEGDHRGRVSRQSKGDREPAVELMSHYEESEDTSVPIDSAFYGVEAGEVTWEEPLSVRQNKPRPLGMPILALDKLAPPPDDPDAAMLEFAYEQQYGKEEAKRMMKEAKTENHNFE
jgi:regulator of extracellular matrix RemA (YlzA/DUF370 family)